MKPPLLLLENVHKTYAEVGRSHAVLRGLEAEIGAGEFVILLGRSGSGKSTLLNLLGGMDLPDSGTVFCDGTAISQLSERDRTLFRRRRIGFIFQFFNLIPTLTVWENLLLRCDLNSAVDAIDQQRALDLLDAVGLADRRSSYPDLLSGGEQQRVAIASALAHDPALILADEPTGNLDLENGQQVIELLDGLVRREGKTMVMATHSREVMGYADRMLSIEDGRLVEQYSGV